MQRFADYLVSPHLCGDASARARGRTSSPPAASSRSRARSAQTQTAIEGRAGSPSAPRGHAPDGAERRNATRGTSPRTLAAHAAHPRLHRSRLYPLPRPHAVRLRTAHPLARPLGAPGRRACGGQLGRPPRLGGARAQGPPARHGRWRGRGPPGTERPRAPSGLRAGGRSLHAPRGGAFSGGAPHRPRSHRGRAALDAGDRAARGLPPGGRGASTPRRTGWWSAAFRCPPSSSRRSPRRGAARASSIA